MNHIHNIYSLCVRPVWSSSMTLESFAKEGSAIFFKEKGPGRGFRMFHSSCVITAATAPPALSCQMHTTPLPTK